MRSFNLKRSPVTLLENLSAVTNMGQVLHLPVDRLCSLVDRTQWWARIKVPVKADPSPVICGGNIWWFVWALVIWDDMLALISVNVSSQLIEAQTNHKVRTWFEFRRLLREELLLPWDGLIDQLISESSKWSENPLFEKCGFSWFVLSERFSCFKQMFLIKQIAKELH